MKNFPENHFQYSGPKWTINTTFIVIVCKSLEPPSSIDNVPIFPPPSPPPPLYLQEYLDTPSMIFEKFEPPINKE